MPYAVSPDKRIFVDDAGNQVKTVTAEQHALDNRGHRVEVRWDWRSKLLILTCQAPACPWFDEQGGDDNASSD